MTKTLRNSNHELLRIIAMYMIIFIHANMYLFHFCEGKTGVFFNGLVNGICNIGVSCFILISGYYGLRFSIKKLVKMECMMITYSLLELVLLLVFFPEQLEGAALLEQLVKSFLPFITRKYWFYSSYVCLFLLSGFIQKFIDQLKKEEFERLLMLLLFLFSILPTFCYFELVPDNGKGLVQMVMVYLLGRYIRVHKDIHIPVKKAMLLFVVLWGINGVSHELPIQVGGIYHHLCKDNSITNLVMAVILFYCFKELSIQSKIINRLASYIFAVFALNNTLVRVVMETVLDKGIRTTGNAMGFLMLAGIVAVLLGVCLIAGVIREGLLSRLDKKLGAWIEEMVFGITKNVKKMGKK